MIGSLRKFLKKKIRTINKEIYNEFEKNINQQMTLYYPYLNNTESYSISREFIEYAKCEQGLPVPDRKLWLGYGNDMDEHLYSGKNQVQTMINIVKNTGQEFYKLKRILDFGCGSGRLIRWLKPYSAKSEIWGVDISSEHIYWANQYLNPPFNFATSTTIPHLPFEDKYFDMIYAGSVFTHIDDLSDSWLLELRRILSPDGFVYLTIHDKHTIELLKSVPVWKESMLSKYLSSNTVFKSINGDFNMFVGMRGPDSQVFYDIDYFCKTVRGIFEVISITQEAYGYQTAVLMRRRKSK